MYFVLWPNNNNNNNGMVTKKVNDMKASVVFKDRN